MAETVAHTRARRSENRRDELLDAAEELFRDRGVASTAVSDITDRAGVAKGTFYLYFDSKDHVVAALYERTIEGMTAVVERSVEQLTSTSVLEVADDLTARIIDYWIEQRELFRAIREAGESAETARMKADCDQRIIEMFEAGIAVGVERGEISVSDPQRVAQFIFFGCQGATVSALLAPGRIQRKRLVEATQETIRKILRP